MRAIIMALIPTIAQLIVSDFGSDSITLQNPGDSVIIVYENDRAVLSFAKDHFMTEFVACSFYIPRAPRMDYHELLFFMYNRDNQLIIRGLDLETRKGTDSLTFNYPRPLKYLQVNGWDYCEIEYEGRYFADYTASYFALQLAMTIGELLKTGMARVYDKLSGNNVAWIKKEMHINDGRIFLTFSFPDGRIFFFKFMDYARGMEQNNSR